MKKFFIVGVLCLLSLGAYIYRHNFCFDWVGNGAGATITKFYRTPTEFYKSRREARSIVIPDKIAGKKVTAIGGNAFKDCFLLDSLILPDGLESIGDYAFSCCSSLKSLTLPDGLKSIGANAFKGCPLTIVASPGTVGAEYAARHNDIRFLNKNLETLRKEIFPDAITIEPTVTPY